MTASKSPRKRATKARSARLFAVGGGKGGVGKSFLSANLSAALASMGKRVVAVDADLEGANLHTCLGVEKPHCSFADFIAGRELDVMKLALETKVPNLQMIAATHANFWSPQPTAQQRYEFIRGLRALPVDVVLIDLGAGMHPPVLDYYLSADDGILVFTPEPTSVENGHAFLRAAFFRGMHLWMKDSKVRDLIASAMDQGNEQGIRSPFDLMRAVEDLDPEQGTRFVSMVKRMRPRLIMNEVRSARDIKMGFAMRSVVRKFFGIDAEYLGYVNHQDAARRSIIARKPLVITHPKSDAAIYIGRIARKLAAPTGSPESKSQ